MFTTDGHKNLLNETNIFAGINDSSLDRIVAIAREQKYETHEILYKPGDDAIDFYVLVSGRVRFSVANTTGMLSSGTVIRNRMIFGWAALLPEHPLRLGSAQCLEPSALLAMNGDKVLDVLRVRRQNT